jgi:hypothetical protein
MSSLSRAPPAEPDLAYCEQLRAVEGDLGQLIFLIGCQRSGTTWLHLQLARTGAFRFLTAYDVHASHTLVHNWRQGLSARERQSLDEEISGKCRDRGIDSIPAGSDTPEEYGLVINRDDQDTSRMLRYDRPDTTDANLARLRELCAKKTLIEGRERPLLLKSPPDYAGAIVLLAGAWPRAKFIAIQRHPLRTLQSQIMAWRALVVRKNEYLSLIDEGYRMLMEDTSRRMAFGLFLHSQAGVDWLADCILRAHQEFLSLRQRFSGASLHTVRYEDLCADQSTNFARMGEFLGVPLAVPQHPPLPRNEPISDEARRTFHARRSAFAPYLDCYGYSAEAE